MSLRELSEHVEIEYSSAAGAVQRFQGLKKEGSIQVVMKDRFAPVSAVDLLDSQWPQHGPRVNGKSRKW